MSMSNQVMNECNTHTNPETTETYVLIYVLLQLVFSSESHLYMSV